MTIRDCPSIQALLGRDGKVDPHWQRWFGDLAREVNSGATSTSAPTVEIPSFVLSGAGSVAAEGAVSAGEFVVNLGGDKDSPPPNSFYGADSTGEKGFVPLYDGLTEGVGIALRDSGYIVIDTVASPDDLPLTGNAGEAVRVTDDEPGLYAWDGAAFTLDAAADGKVTVALDDAPSDGVTYGRKNGAWVVATGSGLIAVATVAGSAATSLSVSGLDLATDYAYRIVFSLKNATVSTNNPSLYYNGDTTDAHYWRQQITESNTTNSGSRANDALIAAMASSGQFSGEILLQIDVDGKPRAYCAGNRESGSTLQLQNFVHWWDSATNVTSFALTGAANGFAVGSYIRVYQL